MITWIESIVVGDRGENVLILPRLLIDSACGIASSVILWGHDTPRSRVHGEFASADGDDFVPRDSGSSPPGRRSSLACIGASESVFNAKTTEPMYSISSSQAGNNPFIRGFYPFIRGFYPFIRGVGPVPTRVLAVPTRVLPVPTGGRTRSYGGSNPFIRGFYPFLRGFYPFLRGFYPFLRGFRASHGKI